MSQSSGTKLVLQSFGYPLELGHDPHGALGYVDAAAELLAQLAIRDLKIDHIVVTSGSGATHAGLLFGLRALGSAISVTQT